MDDLQLSLAIGKRGQNVRLAAKLIGWKIDIKSEEEKRREMEVRMVDMVISGAPVSVLIDHGLDESIVEQLVGADIGTVERLGAMTPEELEVIPNITEEIVSQIQSAVVSFYGEYDEAGDGNSEGVEAEAVPADEESVEAAIDASTSATSEQNPNSGGESIPAFENIRTGVLEHDLATHESALVEESDGTQVLDLGRVEGLSGAPSVLHNVAGSGGSGETE